MLSVNELNELAKRIAKDYWGLDLNVSISYNSARRRLGVFKIRSRFDASKNKIEISNSLESVYGYPKLLSVLKHELCHWALYTLNKPFRDGDSYFEEELIRIGADSTRTIKAKGKFHVIECSKCGKCVGHYIRQSAAIDKDRNPDYSSRCCDAALIYAGEKEI
jgi:SprT-like protein